MPEGAIRDAGLIHPGMVIVRRTGGGHHDVYRVLELAAMNDDSLGVRTIDLCTSKEELLSLADMGVVPYRYVWNQTNCAWELSEFQRRHGADDIAQHDQGGQLALSMTT
jgi:hypothetical protein